MFGLFHKAQPRPSRDRLEHLARTLESLGVSQDDPELGQQILASAAEVRARSESGAVPSHH